MIRYRPAGRVALLKQYDVIAECEFESRPLGPTPPNQYYLFIIVGDATEIISGHACGPSRGFSLSFFSLFLSFFIVFISLSLFFFFFGYQTIIYEVYIGFARTRYTSGPSSGGRHRQLGEEA